MLNSAKEKGERLREKGGKMAVNVKKEVRISEIRTAIRSRELWKMAIRKINIFNIINFWGSNPCFFRIFLSAFSYLEVVGGVVNSFS